MPRHRESPVKRINPSGEVVWKARYTARDGSRPSAGTFKLKRDAQAAIDAAYAAKRAPRLDTLGEFAAMWQARFPRPSERTDKTNEGRVRAVLDVEVAGRPLRDWPMRELHRLHALELVNHMLTVQGRSASGAQNILRALSALAEDAITARLADGNWVRGVKVTQTDRRARKKTREIRVFGWEQMHEVAAAAGHHEAMIRTLSDCGLRIGELFALERAGLDAGAGALRVEGSAWEGEVTGTTEEKNHDRLVPLPAAALALVRAMPPRIDSELLFPTPTGKLYRYNNWRRDVWNPAIRAVGTDMRPNEMRHSFVSLLLAAGVDEADLAKITGHSVQTMTGHYRHALGRSFDEVRRLVG